MRQLRNILTRLLLVLGLLLPVSGYADTIPAVLKGMETDLDSMARQNELAVPEQKESTVDVKEIVFGHIGDSYEWHITTWGKT